MIDFKSDELLSLKEAVEFLPKRNGKSICCYGTLRTWTHTGRRGVILESIFIGGTKYTTRAAIEKFIAEYTRRRLPKPLPGQIDREAADRAKKQVMAMLNYTR